MRLEGWRGRTPSSEGEGDWGPISESEEGGAAPRPLERSQRAHSWGPWESLNWEGSIKVGGTEGTLAW